VNDKDIDEVLHQAAQTSDALEPALLQRVAASLQPLEPVRPLPRTWVLATALLFLGAAIALVAAFHAGFYGFAKMDLLERLLIFSTLACFACVAAAEFVHSMIPGSRRLFTPENLLLLASILLLAIFALLFHDYHTDHFLSAGILCLVTGVAHAIPVGLLGWLLLRRGLALNRVAAGLLGGAFAGLAGITLLELHCPNFQAFHILVWHTAVLPVSAALGALLGYLLNHHLRRTASVGPEGTRPSH